MRKVLFALLLLSGSSFAEEYKRVYLATYPRSGNHWMRYLIEEATHVATSSVYRDNEPPHLETLFPWNAYSTKNGYEGHCRYPETGEVVVVKTHYPCLGNERSKLPYSKIVHIVRHPVDSLYSYYQYKTRHGTPSTIIPRDALVDLVDRMSIFDAYWKTKENILTLRYEDFLADPYTCLKQTLEFIGYQVEDADIQRAILKHPPQGHALKHLLHYAPDDLAYLAEKLHGYMQQYGYSLTGSGLSF